MNLGGFWGIKYDLVGFVAFSLSLEGITVIKYQVHSRNTISKTFIDSNYTSFIP